MFCPNCGKPVGNGMRFCANCGSALAQNSSQQAAPAADSQMNVGGSIYYPDGRYESGTVLLSPTEIVMRKKSAFIAAAFGLVGSMLDKGKESLRLNISDIAYGRKDKYRMNKNAYYVTMKNGDTYVLCLENPKTSIPYLDSIIGRY